jgi:GT2 family glycosyltransferase
MDLSIIIVNWNSVDYLQECVGSVEQYTNGATFEFVVVDNRSAAGETERIEQVCPQIKLIKSDENLGFAKANNLGFRNSTGKFVLFLNPDTKLIGPAINRMLNQIQALPDAGIVGCKLLNSDLSAQLSSIQTFPTILNQVLDAEYLLLKWPRCPLWNVAPLFSSNIEPVKVDVISGACMMMKREVFERAGMFSEDYFMYAEDLDLNFKVRRAGYFNYYVGDAAIIHHGGKSSSRQKVSQWTIVMKHRAMCRYFQKTKGRPYEWMYRVAMSCAAAGRLLILTLMFPYRKKEWVRDASAKWKTILKSMIGFHVLPVQN